MEQISIGKGCPHLPFNIENGGMTPCQKHDCMMWRPIQLNTVHPQTGEKITQEQWDCVHPLNFIGVLDVGKKVCETGAAIESLRNVIVKKQAELEVQTEQPIKLLKINP